MVWSVFTRRKGTSEGIVHPGFASVGAHTVRDARGFDVGVVMTANRAIGAVGVMVADSACVDSQSVARWRDDVAAHESVISTCVAQRMARGEVSTVLWACMQAQAKAERKDVSEFLTRIARFSPVVYDSADVAGMDTRPLSPAGLARWVAPASDGETFPPRVGTVAVRPESLSVDDVTVVSFELACDESAPSLCDEAGRLGLELSQVSDCSVALARWSRIGESAGAFRDVGVLSIVGDNRDVVESGASMIIAGLDARARLRVRRLWHRQAMGAGAAVGAGVLGWNLLEVK